MRAEVDFTDLSLEELMDVEVTSVSKRPQRLADAAAAVFVITEEDIRRSGATSIPELLRMAPGVDVARIDANKWAVSIRGFNGRFASKLLVLIDGRSVYNPLFSNVFWEAEDVVLEDIDRIEVVRGPGATLWGSNAVNGVINIITKSAKDTQGLLLSGGGGTEQRAFATTRYGGQIGDDLFYRAYAKGVRLDDGAVASGDSGADETDLGRTGFRLDWAPTEADQILLAGDVFAEDYGSTGVRHPLLVPPYLASFDDNGSATGGSVLVRWSRGMSDTSEAALQGSYNRLDKQEQGLEIKTDVAELDFQHAFEPVDGHRLVWGSGYRYSHADLVGGGVVDFNLRHENDSRFSGFLQDEMTLLRHALFFTIGSRFEHTEATGSEIQPSARMLWSPTARQSVWAAVSRAVRTPSIGETGADILEAVIPPGTSANPGPVPIEVSLFGNEDLRSEELLAFELGYRANPVDKVNLDLSVFYNVYDKLREAERGSPALAAAPVPRVVLPIAAQDRNAAESYGVEVATDWEVMPWWRLKAAYSFLQVLGDSTMIRRSGSPQHQASLRSLMNLGSGWQLDLWPRYVDNLPALGVESYFDLDARLAWRPNDTVEFAIVGQNLLDSRRGEMVPEFLPLTPTQVERGVYGKLTVNF